MKPRSGAAGVESDAARLARALATADLAEWSFDLRDTRWLIVTGFEPVFGPGAPRDVTAANVLPHAGPADDRMRTPFTDGVLGECLHPEDVSVVASAWHRLADVGEALNLKVHISGTDGQPRWISIDGEVSAWSDGVPIRLSGHVRDVTEIERLRATNDFLAGLAIPLAHMDDYDDTLQQVASEAVPFLADRCLIEFVLAEGELQRVADSLYPRHASPQLPPERSAACVPAARLIDRIVRERHTLVLPDIGETEIEGLSATEEYRRELRGYRPCDYIGTPLAVDGRCFGVMSILTRRDGRRFTTQDPGLVERVAERIASALENARLYAALKEVNEKKTHFLAMLSHELRNPLAAVTAGLDAIRDNIVSPIDRSTLAMIDRQASGLSHLMDDLLDVARIDADKLELNFEWVSVSRAIDDAMAGVARMTRDKRQKLSSRAPEPDVSIRADRVRLEQILANLLVNASRYTPDGGSISIEARHEGGSVVVEVSDTGIGLEEDERHRIFERFEQVHEAHSLGNDGLGLGLNLVRSLVALHGGTIVAQSEGKGLGSLFRLTLPHVRRSVPDGERKLARPPDDGAFEPQPVRVLVIDDNQDAARALGTILGRLGHDVADAATGEEGASAYASRPARLVILDIGLPDIDGYAVAGRIRAHERDARLPSCWLVALTGYGQSADRLRALGAGFDEHVVKPIRLERLRELLRIAARPRDDAAG